MISREKWGQLITWMEKLTIQDSELIEKFIIGSGRGGQNLHKTASTVYLKYIPLGIEIKCQETRSREENRYFARIRLCEKLDTIHNDEKSRVQQEIEKIKRQKKRRSRRIKQKILAEKSKQSQTKSLRKKPGFYD